MANRDALRDLQARLATRLQQARTESPVGAWLAVECAGLGVLLPLATAGEIFALTTLLPVPHTQPWFIGVANLRGGLHGVVDLAAFLGLRPPLPVDAPREQAQLLAFNPKHGAHCAVLVDKLAGLRSADQMTMVPPEDRSPATARPAFAGACWKDADGRLWQELDLAVLARSELFLAIAA